jgi:hypothetical protein
MKRNKDDRNTQQGNYSTREFNDRYFKNGTKIRMCRCC